MKNVKLFGCAWIMAMASLMATPKPYDQIVQLSDLNDQVMQDFAQGEMRDLVVACPVGTNLPFKLTMKGEFLESDSIAQLNVLKTCYVRCEEKEHFLFSTDLQDWRGFSEFFTGRLNLSVEIENGEPVAALQFELNQRKI